MGSGGQGGMVWAALDRGRQCSGSGKVVALGTGKKEAAQKEAVGRKCERVGLPLYWVVVGCEEYGLTAGAPAPSSSSRAHSSGCSTRGNRSRNQSL